MDPQATLLELIDAMNTVTDGEKHTEVIEIAGNLADWLDRGGFVPAIDADCLCVLLSAVREAYS